MHPFSAFDALGETLDSAERALWGWAEPIVVDRAADWYGRCLEDPAEASTLAFHHRQLWREAVHDRGSIRRGTADLRRTASAFGLDPASVDAANEVILRELMDIVLCRFRTSRHATRAFGLALMSISSSVRARLAA